MMALEGYFIVLAPAILTTLLMLWIEVMPLVRKFIDTTTGSTTHLELVREICSHTAFYGSVGSYLLGTQAGSTAAAYTVTIWFVGFVVLASMISGSIEKLERSEHRTAHNKSAGLIRSIANSEMRRGLGGSYGVGCACLHEPQVT